MVSIPVVVLLLAFVMACMKWGFKGAFLFVVLLFVGMILAAHLISWLCEVLAQVLRQAQ